MAVALETVVKQLEDSGIVAAGKLENFVPPKAHPTSVEELVAELVKQNHLTKFQAVQVAAGKAKSLILGGYTIVDKIGAGGMGQVFKAEHRRMKRVVAIKMLPAGTMKDPAVVARFQREVEAAAKLRHTNIVAADDADEAYGIHFLVMEYVEGKDLSALVKKDGPFSVAKAVSYVLQAARGLEFAHSEGVVHRDIKPANLLLDKKGTVKILDMGLARIESQGNVAAQAELTGTGTIMGTVDYMAPEQGTSTKHADARADIYSLGCTLHYLIVGKATYPGETIAAKLVAHHTAPIPDLRTISSDVSAELDAVFKKMVAKRVEDRYQTMAEVIADLEQCRISGSGVGGQGSGSGTSGSGIGSVGSQSGLMPTIVTDAPIIKTDKPAPTKKTAAPVVRDPAKPQATNQGGKGNKPPLKLIAAGIGGFALLASLGVWLIVRDKENNEVARVAVPEGGSATVVTKPPQQPNTPVANAPGSQPTSPQSAVSFFGGAKTPPSFMTTTPTQPTVPGVPGAPIDLIAQFDAARDDPKGTWKKESSSLKGSGTLKLFTPQPVPEEYDLDAEIDLAQRYNKGLALGFLTGGRQPALVMDFDGVWVLSDVDGQNNVKLNNPTRVTDLPWPVNQRVPVKLSVRRDGVRVLFRDQPVIDWRGTAAQLSANPYFTNNAPNAFFFHCGSPYTIHRLALTPYLPPPANIPGEALTFNGHRYLLVDAPGDWVKAKAAAEAMGGHLATINSLTERDWIRDNIWLKRSKTDKSARIHLGAWRPFGQVKWRWVTGEPFDETLWLGTVPPPKNDGKTHDDSVLWSTDTSWAVVAVTAVDSTTYFLVEWDTLSAPTPAANTTSPGVAGHALDFEGTRSYVAAPLGYDGNPPLTLEGWITLPRENRGGFSVIEVGETGSPHFALKFSDAWHANFSDGGSPSVFQIAKESTTRAADSRVHVAVTWDGKAIRTFVNGQPGIPTKLQAKLTAARPKGALKIGVGPAHGTIDEVRISKSLRYEADFTPQPRFEPDADTLALYHFDEGSGTEAKDSSGKNNHATIVAAKWVAGLAGGALPPTSGTSSAALDLIALTDPAQDRFFVPQLIGENKWTRADGKLTYTTDGKAGAIVAPVSLADCKEYEVAADVRRLSGNSVFTFNLPLAIGRQTGVDVFIGGRIEFKLEGGNRKNMGQWPAAAGDGGHITLRVRLGTDGRIEMRVNDQVVAQWNGDTATIGHPNDEDGPRAEQMPTSLFCFKDSFEFTSWKVTGLNGAPRVLREPAAAAGSMPPPAVAPFDAAQAKAHQAAWAAHLDVKVETTNSLGATMILIPPGEFQMGNTPEQEAGARRVAALDRLADNSLEMSRLPGETPSRIVTLTKPYYLGATEVTLGQFKKFVAAIGHQTDAEKAAKAADAPTYLNPKYAVGDDSPVTYVSWNDADAFCRWLSSQEKATYRPATEAEWEFACRAGTTTQFSFGDDAAMLGDYGWSNKNSQNPQPVAKKIPNPFGLFDMHGNVWEICSDWYQADYYAHGESRDPAGPPTGTERVNRSGNWRGLPMDCRSAARGKSASATVSAYRGFRVVREVELPAGATRTAAPAKRRFASDEWIDVLPLIDPALDKYDVPNLTGKNEWRIENGELVAAAEGKPCKLLLPLDLDGLSFECEIEFTRTGGTRGFNFDVPVALGPSPLHFDRDGDGRALLGKKGVPLSGKVALKTGERGTIRSVVRRVDGVDEVEAWFNGASLGKWTGNRDDLAMMVRNEGYPHDRRLSLWIFGDPFVFHRLRLRMLDGGAAETLRPVAATPTTPAPAPSGTK